MAVLHGDLESIKHSESFMKKIQKRAESMTPFFKKLLYSHLCVPMEDIQYLPEVLNLTHNTVFINTPDFLNAKDEIFHELKSHTIIEYFELLLKIQPVFRVNCTYLSRFKSLELIEEWLNYQFGTNSKEFITTLFNVLTKQVKKKSIFLWGPPDSGKTYMMKTLCDLFINVGILGVLHNSRFAFAPLADARIVLWDEPKWDPIHENSLKLMLSGGYLSVEEKQKKQVVVSGLPIIICSNPETIFDWNDPIWTSRIHKYKVKRLQCTLINEQIHPLAFIDLFTKYNLLKTINE